MDDRLLDRLPEVYARYFRLRDGLDDAGLAAALDIAIEALPALRRIAEDKLVRASEQGSSPPLVLVVEDNPTNLKLATVLLHATGCRMSTATTGSDAVEAARILRPDVVVLDVVLPDMAGERVLEVLRADHRTADIPIVAVTALAMVGDRERLLRQGFDAYLSKPIDARTFAGDVLRHIGRHGPPRESVSDH